MESVSRFFKPPRRSRKVQPEDLRSLRAFREDYPEATPVLVYRGEEKLKVGGVLCVPCEELLCQLHPARKGILSAL